MARQNESAYAVDLAVGRWVKVFSTVVPDIAGREDAKAIFQRVAPVGNLTILDAGSLCKPLWAAQWAFPVLGNTSAAQAFFRENVNKWDAEQWLVCSKLY